MNAVKLGTLVVSVSALFAGCSSTPVATPAETAPAPVAAAPVAAPAPAPVAAPAPAANANARSAAPALAAHLDPTSRISQERSVFFDFDKFDIKPEFNGLVEAHGKYLAANPGLAVKVEGNADERGSKEYNLALGQKRAESVVRALKTFGAGDKQLEPVSWGEEKPVATGHDEAAFSKNRRADVTYPSK